jgi:hypothetical protein
MLRLGKDLPHSGFTPGLTIGRAPPPSSRSAAFALPPPSVARDLGWCDHETIEALVGFCSPILLRPGFFLCTLDYEPAKPVHKKHNTRRYEHPLAGGPGRSGRGYADFHAGVNFAFTEF